MEADSLMRIAITPPDIRIGEAAMITAVFDAGWDYVHLRHPQASARDIKRIIEDIPQSLPRDITGHVADPVIRYQNSLNIRSAIILP